MDFAKGFSGKWDFLSNFFECEVHFNGLVFTNSEAAYQSAKCANAINVPRFVGLTGAEAKKLGRKIKVREDWDLIKEDVMYTVVLDKFLHNNNVRQKLIDTGDIYIEEVNWWKDTFWGVCDGKGQNKLGLILMRVRHEIQHEFLHLGD